MMHDVVRMSLGCPRADRMRFMTDSHRPAKAEVSMNVSDYRAAINSKASYSAAISLFPVAIGVVLVAFNLRPPITTVSPLLDQIQREEGFNSTVASLLVAVPLIC